MDTLFFGYVHLRVGVHFSAFWIKIIYLKFAYFTALYILKLTQTKAATLSNLLDFQTLDLFVSFHTSMVKDIHESYYAS